MDIEKTKSYYNQIRSEDLCDCDYCRNNIHEVKAAYPISFIDTHPIPREFHNVNYRFCGAIHSVNWACISVLSQVIHNVNKRKTVQTNMISFVSHGANFVKLCFTKFLLRSPAECPANRNIIFRLYRFSFHKPIRSRLVRGRLYLPFTTYKSTTESATLRPLNSGLQCIAVISYCFSF